jgi:hypothetical protein
MNGFAENFKPTFWPSEIGLLCLENEKEELKFLFRHAPFKKF